MTITIRHLPSSGNEDAPDLDASTGKGGDSIRDSPACSCPP
jgi:hypothetical protein